VLDSREAGCINGYHFSRHDVVIFPEGAELDYRLPAATNWCSIQLSRTLLEQADCAEIGFDRVKILPGNRSENAHLARILEGQAAAPRPGVAGSRRPSPLNDEIVLEQIRRTLNEHLGRRDQGRRASLSSRMAMMRQFEQQLGDRINTVVRIPLLCAELSISQRTLENLFKEEIGMTPKRFSSVLQLNSVRQELLRMPAEHSRIVEIAEHHGITHLGRFAAAYQRQFGERPSETLGTNKHA